MSIYALIYHGEEMPKSCEECEFSVLIGLGEDDGLMEGFDKIKCPYEGVIWVSPHGDRSVDCPLREMEDVNE